MALTNTMTDKTGAYSRNKSTWSQPNPDITPEAGRYHLYVALACPWACGALQMLKLRGLEGKIGYSIVHSTWQRTRPNDAADSHFGWAFRSPGDAPLANPAAHGAIACDDALIPDPVMGAQFVRDLYAANGDDTGPFTTPLLFDKIKNEIVSNESMVILKLLHDKFGAIAENPCQSMYPEGAAAEALTKMNEELVYPRVNNGVYRSGFSKKQEPYEAAVTELFGALDELEVVLANKRYLGGDTFTWLDLRLFNTLVRFDPVYNVYFKCNLRRIIDYPNLLAYTRDVYQSFPAVAECINMDHIKTHYYTSHKEFNLYGVVPIGNGPDLTVPHNREHVGAQTAAKKAKK
jgi:putative glutathione S-transferase